MPSPTQRTSESQLFWKILLPTAIALAGVIVALFGPDLFKKRLSRKARKWIAWTSFVVFLGGNAVSAYINLGSDQSSDAAQAPEGNPRTDSATADGESTQSSPLTPCPNIEADLNNALDQIVPAPEGSDMIGAPSAPFGLTLKDGRRILNWEQSDSRATVTNILISGRRPSPTLQDLPARPDMAMPEEGECGVWLYNIRHAEEDLPYWLATIKPLSGQKYCISMNASDDDGSQAEPNPSHFTEMSCFTT